MRNLSVQHRFTMLSMRFKPAAAFALMVLLLLGIHGAALASVFCGMSQCGSPAVAVTKASAHSCCEDSKQTVSQLTSHSSDSCCCTITSASTLQFELPKVVQTAEVNSIANTSPTIAVKRVAILESNREISFGDPPPNLPFAYCAPYAGRAPPRG